MGKFKAGVTSVVATILGIFAIGCGQQTVNVPDTTRPVVSSTTPANGSLGIPLVQAISATFSKPINPSTVNASTFTVSAAGGVPVTGTVAYNPTGSVATFTPTAPLLANTLYTGTITTGVQDTAQPANALGANYVWSFRTVVIPPTVGSTNPANGATGVAPTVVSTNPANGATGVALNQGLTAVFSAALDPTSLNATTFTVRGPGGVVIPGTVTYAGTTATFTPTAVLPLGTLLTAAITTGVQDPAGVALAANYVFSFTTIAPPTVLSANPANEATGVALNQALSVVFSRPLNAGTINSTTFIVRAPGGVAIPGTVLYTGTTATFTPTVPLPSGTLLTATITTGAQDPAGVALAANYVFSFTTIVVPPTIISTTPLNGATGVALNQAVNVVFSTPLNPATITTGTFTVTSPGAVAVGGVVTYAGTTATFTPSAALTANTLYIATISTGVQDLAGEALAANYGFSFRTAPAPTPLTVISTAPANTATGVPLNQAVSVTFSGAVNPATANASTLTVSGPGGVLVAGTVTYVAAGSVATFTPAAALSANTLYTVTITTAVSDLLGTALAANDVFTFTTGVAPDTTRPTVLSTNPISNATNVPFNQAISATFSKALLPGTIDATSFTLTAAGTTPVAGIVTYAAIGNTATFTPTAPLAAGTLFTATITTGVTDLAGNTLAVNYIWNFTTGALPNTTPPTIVLTSPANGATGVALNQVVGATFSEALDPLTITNATFQLTDPNGVVVAATLSYDATSFIATLTPSAPLTGGTTYTATVTTGSTDLVGNPLAAGGIPNPWIFTTGVAIVPPAVPLGRAAPFGAFGGGAGITNQGVSTVINGDIGTTGVSTLITGFHDNTPNCTYTETPLNVGLVNGSIYTAPPPPTVGCPTEGTALTSAIAAGGAADALTAYNNLVAFPNGLDVSVCPACGGGSAGELGNRVLPPGVYLSAPGAYALSQGDLTLDAQGDPNAFWVFQMSTSLTVGDASSNRNVLLINGAQPKNVFWQVGSAATINPILGGGTMVGTIIAQAAITVSTPGVAAVTTINGRLLGLNAGTTMVNTVINVPAP